MGKIAFPVAIVLCALLGACAASPTLEVASLALDGASYLITGKGSTDQALSTMAGGDCRLANVLHGRDVCHADKGRTVAVATLLPPADAPRVADTAPARNSRVRFTESAGMNLATVAAAPDGSSLDGNVDGAGTLHVFMVAPDGAREGTALFTVPGYARNPGAFTGVVLGTNFLAPDAFVR